MSESEQSTDGVAKQSLFPRVESLLRFGTAGVGLVAAIGLPAVAIHLIRFGAPVNTAGYSDVLRAGVLPAVVLVIVGTYCFAAVRALQKMTLRKFLAFHSLLLVPLVVLAYAALIAGLVAYTLMIVWGVLWSVCSLGGLVFGFNVNNRTLLLIAGAIAVGMATTWIVLKLTQKRWSTRPGKLWKTLDAALAPRQRQRSPDKSDGESDGQPAQATTGSKKPESKWDWALGLVFLPTLLLMLYSMKGLLHIWDPSLGAAFYHRHVVLATVVLGVPVTVFLAVVLHTLSESADDKPAPRHKTAVLVVAVLAYLGFEALYSVWGYPRLPSGLGGGRPRSVTLWVKSDDDALDVCTVLTNAEVTHAGGLNRVDHVFLLLDGEKEVLLTDTPAHPGKSVLVSRSRVMGVSW
jgi:hypothetical protein